MLYEHENLAYAGQTFQRGFAASLADAPSREGVARSLAFQFLVGVNFGWLLGVAVITASTL